MVVDLKKEDTLSRWLSSKKEVALKQDNIQIITVNGAMEALNVSYPTATKIIDNFCKLDILIDITPEQKRNKRYAFSRYLEILNRGTV